MGLVSSVKKLTECTCSPILITIHWFYCHSLLRRGSRWVSPQKYAPRSLFLSPQPPHNTKRPLRRRELLSHFQILIYNELLVLFSFFCLAPEEGLFSNRNIGQFV